MRARFPRVCYAVKAFTSHAVLRIAVEEGLDLLVASGGELEAALRAGVPGPRIAMHGNNKSDDELAAAVAAGVSFVVVDHTGELNRLDAAAAEAGVVQDVLIRATPGVDSDTHPSIATGHAGSTFGMPPAEAVRAAARIAELPAIRFAGVHAHLGSQLLDVRPYLEEVDVLLDLLAAIRDATGAVGEILDVGGGFGVRYTGERALDVDGLAARLLERVREGSAERDLVPPSVAVEPGRSLVANTRVTLYRVGAVKEVGGRRSAAVDGGMSDNPRPSLYGARYELALADPPRAAATSGRHDRRAALRIRGRPRRRGPTCRPICAAATCWRRGDGRLHLRDGQRLQPGRAPCRGRCSRRGRHAVAPPRGRGRPRPAGGGGASARSRPAADPGGRHDPAGDAAGRRLVPRVLVGHRRGGAVRAQRDASATPPGCTGRGSATRGPTARPRSSRWTGTGSSATSTSSARSTRPRSTSRRSASRWRPIAPRPRASVAALMSECVRWAREVGVEKIVLSVYPHNTGAIALYRSFGFVEEGRLAAAVPEVLR